MPDTTIILSEVPSSVGLYASAAGSLRVSRTCWWPSAWTTPASVYQSTAIPSSEQGKPPDFVLEVASPSTGREDYTGKRNDYAAFGIPEYWRFDPSGGLHHSAPLAGDRLVEGAYQPVEIQEMGPAHRHGHSDVLGLDLCWEDGRLRWWDPAARRYLMTFDEERDARIAAEDLADDAQARAGREQEGRTAAEARVRELEAELERHRRD